MSLKTRVLVGGPLGDVDIIDAHMHLNAPPFYVPAADAAALIAAMDKYGIRRGIIAPQLAITCDMRAGNDEALAAAAASGGRLMAYCTVNPRYPEEMNPELERCFAAGAVAVKIHPGIHDTAVTDPAYNRVYTFAQERGVPVLAHTWGESPRHGPRLFVEITARFPRLVVILGHAGGTFAGMRETIEAVRARPANLYADLTGSMPYLNRVELLVRAVGAERVLYGSDAPWLEPGQTLGPVLFAAIGDEERRLILGGNIRRLLHLDQA
ncbi:MAG: amidohydrolase family protein [Planctomycetota bacterium]